MSATVSRGIDRRPLWPPPMRMSMIESDRLGPLVDAPGSLEPFARWSEPRTRTVVGDSGGVAVAAGARVAAVAAFRFLVLGGGRERMRGGGGPKTAGAAAALQERPHA